MHDSTRTTQIAAFQDRDRFRRALYSMSSLTLTLQGSLSVQPVGQLLSPGATFDTALLDTTFFDPPNLVVASNLVRRLTYRNNGEAHAPVACGAFFLITSNIPYDLLLQVTVDDNSTTGDNIVQLPIAIIYPSNFEPVKAVEYSLNPIYTGFVTPPPGVLVSEFDPPIPITASGVEDTAPLDSTKIFLYTDCDGLVTGTQLPPTINLPDANGFITHQAVCVLGYNGKPVEIRPVNQPVSNTETYTYHFTFTFAP